MNDGDYDRFDLLVDTDVLGLRDEARRMNARIAVLEAALEEIRDDPQLGFDDIRWIAEQSLEVSNE